MRWAISAQFTTALDSVAFQAGNIRISLLALSKAALFGGILFWLGRTSSNAGQKVIRDQQSVDVQTRELAAKALEIAVFAVVGLLLLNILGLDLTALAVFGGALGVGLGFGLQQIASNFISGIILLLERSLKLGDFIELEDGKSGTSEADEHALVDSLPHLTARKSWCRTTSSSPRDSSTGHMKTRASAMKLNFPWPMTPTCIKCRH